METLWQDAKFGWRILKQSPVFTIVAVLTLALGIGGSTTIFSIMNEVLLSGERRYRSGTPRGVEANPVIQSAAKRYGVEIRT